MPDVFISYAREDRAHVRALAEALSEQGWSVWWDREIKAGKRFAQVIAEALSSARCVVVVWSETSVTSDWVREEAEEGRRRGILIPVQVDEARPPLGFGAIQAVELQGWDGSRTAEPFQRLIASMGDILGPPSGQDRVRNVQPIQHEISSSRPDTEEPATRMAGAPPAPAPLRRDESAEQKPTPAGDVLPSRQRLFNGRTAKWLVAAACLVAASLGLYKLWGGDDPVAPVAPVNVRLDAVLAEGRKPLEREVRFDVSTAATDVDGKRKTIGWDMGGQVRFALSAGRYHVTANYGSASSSMDLKIKAGDTAIQRTLNLQAGILRLSAALSAGGESLKRDVRFDVYEAAIDADGKRKPVAWDMGGPGRFPVSAGRYRVTARYGSAASGMDVEVPAGDENVRCDLNLQAGILRVSAVLTAGGEALKRDVRFDVYKAAIDADGKRESVAWDIGGPGRFPLSAGRYHVTAKYGTASSAIDVEVPAGDEDVRRELNLQAGVLRLSAVLADEGEPLQKGVRFEVYKTAIDADGHRESVAWDMGGQAQFRLSAGRYYVTARSDRGTANTEVTLSAGEERVSRLRLGATKPAK